MYWKKTVQFEFYIQSEFTINAKPMSNTLSCISVHSEGFVHCLMAVIRHVFIVHIVFNFILCFWDILVLFNTTDIWDPHSGGAIGGNSGFTVAFLPLCSAKRSLAELCFRITSLDVAFGHICMGLFQKWKTFIFSCENLYQRFREIGLAASAENHVDLQWAPTVMSLQKMVIIFLL